MMLAVDRTNVNEILIDIVKVMCLLPRSTNMDGKEDPKSLLEKLKLLEVELGRERKEKEITKQK